MSRAKTSTFANTANMSGLQQQACIQIKRDWQTILWHVVALLVSLTALIISIIAFLKTPVVQLHPDTIAKLNALVSNGNGNGKASSFSTAVNSINK